MGWTEGLLSDGALDITKGRYGCSHCNIFMKQTESRAIIKGRALAHTLKIKHVLDKKLTKHSCATQIGFFRELQHCATCHNDFGDPCTCKGKCNCLYCKNLRQE
jgi:hypothetical protein